MRTQDCLLLAALTVVGALGCSDDHGKDTEAHDPVLEAVEEACSHMKSGPSQAVTLTADAVGAPDLSKAHTRLDITFVKLAGGQQGGVGVYKVSTAGDYVFSLSSKASITVSDKDNKEVAAEKSLTSPSTCAEFAAARVYELAVGSYVVSFAAPTDTGVKAVFSKVGAADAH